MAQQSTFLAFVANLNAQNSNRLSQFGQQFPAPVPGPLLVPTTIPLPDSEDEDEEDWVSMASMSSSVCRKLRRRFLWGPAEDEDEDEDLPSLSSPLRTPLCAASESSGSIVREVTLTDVFGSDGSVEFWSDQDGKPSSVTTPPDTQIDVDRLGEDAPSKIEKWMAKGKQLIGKLRPKTTKRPKSNCTDGDPSSPHSLGDPFRRLRGIPEPEDDAVIRQRLMDAHDWDSWALETNVQVEVVAARRLASGLATPGKKRRKRCTLKN